MNDKEKKKETEKEIKRKSFLFEMSEEQLKSKTIFKENISNVYEI
jgi:hypothetical protein